MSSNSKEDTHRKTGKHRQPADKVQQSVDENETADHESNKSETSVAPQQDDSDLCIAELKDLNFSDKHSSATDDSSDGAPEEDGEAKPKNAGSPNSGMPSHDNIDPAQKFHGEASNEPRSAQNSPTNRSTQPNTSEPTENEESKDLKEDHDNAAQEPGDTGTSPASNSNDVSNGSGAEIKGRSKAFFGYDGPFDLPRDYADTYRSNQMDEDIDMDREISDSAANTHSSNQKDEDDDMVWEIPDSTDDSDTSEENWPFPAPGKPAKKRRISNNPKPSYRRSGNVDTFKETQDSGKIDVAKPHNTSDVKKPEPNTAKGVDMPSEFEMERMYNLLWEHYSHGLPDGYDPEFLFADWLRDVRMNPNWLGNFKLINYKERAALEAARMFAIGTERFGMDRCEACQRNRGMFNGCVYFLMSSSSHPYPCANQHFLNNTTQEIKWKFRITNIPSKRKTRHSSTEDYAENSNYKDAKDDTEDELDPDHKGETYNVLTRKARKAMFDDGPIYD